MGFTIPKKTALLRFEGTDYDGAEVTLRLDVPMSFAFEMQDLGEQEKYQESYGLFCERVLISWNLEDDNGIPIPPNLDGLMQLPAQFPLLILNRWTEAVMEVPSPLGETSRNGSTSAEDMTELANVSQSLG